MKTLLFLFAALSLILSNLAFSQSYPIIDTNQELCFDTLLVINCPQPGENFYGQDSQYDGVIPSYQDNNDGTTTDLSTGLIWQKNLFANKFTYQDAQTVADTFSLNGFTDWRLPTIKELYSLIDFRGVTGIDAEDSNPFLDTTFFEFRYGDTSTGERFIDAQYVSSTEYVGTTMNGDFTVFGVNFADGRIKGYGTEMPEGIEKLFEVRLVRGNLNYGVNDFVDNNDGTITDNATGLMWSKTDNGTALNWEQALGYAYQQNQQNYLGYNDWRLPNAKELQSIVDYTRSPQTTFSAAIDPLFDVTTIIDEGGDTNYPFYWTSTTHADGDFQHRYIKAAYIAFGEALGFMEIPPNSGNYILMDVHGAGSQRSDPKQGNPDNYPHGFGPQGDVIRIYNYVRLVRGNSISNNNDERTETINDFSLQQNYPNPFNPTTKIQWELPEASDVNITIYNCLGEKVFILLNKYMSAGIHSEFVTFNSEFPSGVYFYQLKAGDFIETKKMILLK